MKSPTRPPIFETVEKGSVWATEKSKRALWGRMPPAESSIFQRR